MAASRAEGGESRSNTLRAPPALERMAGNPAPRVPHPCLKELRFPGGVGRGRSPPAPCAPRPSRPVPPSAPGRGADGFRTLRGPQANAAHPDPRGSAGRKGRAAPRRVGFRTPPAKPGFPAAVPRGFPSPKEPTTHQIPDIRGGEAGPRCALIWMAAPRSRRERGHPLPPSVCSPLPAPFRAEGTKRVAPPGLWGPYFGADRGHRAWRPPWGLLSFRTL